MAQNPNVKHVDAVLTNISIMHPVQGLVWQEVLPIVPVAKKSDKFFVYDAKERLRLIEGGGYRPPKAYTQEVGYRVSTDDYSCREYAFGDFVEDSEQENADAPLDPLKDTTEDVTEEWHRHEEQRVMDLTFTAGNYPATQKTQLSGSSQWSHADSDPIVALLAARLKLHGKRPNRLLINEDGELALLTHAKILSRLTGGAYPGNPANVTLEDIAKLCRLEKIIVGQAEYDSTEKRSATTRLPLWGKHALLYYYESKPSIKKISLGYVFAWKFYGKPTRVRKIYDEQRGSGGYKIIVEGCTAEKFVSTDMAYFFEDAVA